MSEWRTIESAPKDGTAILLAVEYWKDCPLAVAAAKWVEDDKYPWAILLGDNALAEGRALYWMPLPEPPHD